MKKIWFIGKCVTTTVVNHRQFVAQNQKDSVQSSNHILYIIYYCLKWVWPKLVLLRRNQELVKFFASISLQAANNPGEIVLCYILKHITNKYFHMVRHVRLVAQNIEIRECSCSCCSPSVILSSKCRGSCITSGRQVQWKAFYTF